MFCKRYEERISLLQEEIRRLGGDPDFWHKRGAVLDPKGTREDNGPPADKDGVPSKTKAKKKNGG